MSVSDRHLVTVGCDDSVHFSVGYDGITTPLESTVTVGFDGISQTLGSMGYAGDPTKCAFSRKFLSAQLATVILRFVSPTSGNFLVKRF